MSLFLLSAARISRVSFLASSALAALFALSVTACDDGFCCQAEVSCPEGSHEVAECSTDECFTVEGCCQEKLCQPQATCDALPSCSGAEVEVSTCEGSQGVGCHMVKLCGATIFCEEQPPCEAVPSCDTDDIEQPSGVCPDDAACYTAELCGTSIVCQDNGLAHGCPEVPPTQGEPCPVEVTCEYPVEVDCVEIWTCGEPPTLPNPQPALQALEWSSDGTVCAGEEG